MAEQRLEGSLNHTLDVSGLPAGLYFYQLFQGATAIDQGKLIKE